MVIAIMGVIAGFAIPSYLDYTLKARRSEAKTSLLELQIYLEEYYSENQSYPSNLTKLQSISPNEYYTLSLITADSQQTYQLDATARGTQAKDTHCAVVVNLSSHRNECSYFAESLESNTSNSHIWL